MWYKIFNLDSISIPFLPFGCFQISLDWHDPLPHQKGILSCWGGSIPRYDYIFGSVFPDWMEGVQTFAVCTNCWWRWYPTIWKGFHTCFCYIMELFGENLVGESEQYELVKRLLTMCCGIYEIMFEVIRNQQMLDRCWNSFELKTIRLSLIFRGVYM